MHLSLKSSLGRQILTGIYVKDNRVLDLTTPFSELTFTLEDKSGEGNDATLYSGRYISTDGSTDRGIVADCSAAGAGNYYLSGKVRPNAVTTAELTMDGSTDSGLTGLAADVWQDFTTATASVTPSSVQVGFDGTTASAADWSDVKLIDSSDGSTVARWQLNESADGDLNGYPALDSSGNGYHGTHTGCAGGTGEGIDAEVAGAVFAANEDKMYFDGVDDWVSLGSDFNFGTGNFSVTVSFIGSGIVLGGLRAGNNGWLLYVFSSFITFREITSGTIKSINFDAPIDLSVAHTVTLSRVANTVSLVLDGVTQSDTQTTTDSLGFNQIGARTDGTNDHFTGSIYSVNINGVTEYSGTELVTWTDQIGSNNGTVNGSPATVGQKRATILQTAGMDWNKYRTLTTGVTSGGYTASAESFPSGDVTLNGAGSSGFYVIPLPAGILGDSVVVKGHITITSGSPAIYLREGETLRSNIEVLTTSGDFELSGASALISTSVYSNLTISDADIPSEYTFTNLRVEIDGKNYLIPASDTTPTNDALGNAIAEPRPTADTWNLFGDGEYGQVADADSLDLTTEATWEIWGNLYGDFGVDKDFLSKYDTSDIPNSSWVIYQNDGEADDELTFLYALGSGFTTYKLEAIPDAVAHIVFTHNNGILKGYINGVEGVVSRISITGAPSSLQVGTADLHIGSNFNGTSASRFAERQLSRPKIYNRAFTADEVLKNYNAQKGAFGL